MVNILSERRMVENEAFFRQANEKIQKRLDKLSAAAKSDGLNYKLDNDSLQLHFYCECADENCRKRVVLKVSEYRKIHEKRDQFVLLPGHEVSEIEHTVNTFKNYIVVEKLLNPPEAPAKLHVTEVSNV